MTSGTGERSFDESLLYMYRDDIHLQKRGFLWLVRTKEEVDLLPESAVMLTCDQMECLRYCEAFFSRYIGVFLAYEDTAVVDFVARSFNDYLPKLKVYTPKHEAFKGAYSICELVDQYGENALESLVSGAIEKSVHGLINIADVEIPQRKRGILSGIRELDRGLGGFSKGELSIWTGKRGSGKSTLLSQIMLESIDQGHIVCAYSGELPAWNFKSWAQIQAAGCDNVKEQYDPESGKVYYTISDDVASRIDRWWNGKIYLYDNTISDASEEDSILETFTMAVMRYNCDFFIVDNLMSARFDASRDSDYFRQQSNFVGRMVEFCKANDVSCHIVAHPRKTSGKGLVNDDVGGSGDITNRADNVFALTRFDEDDGEEHEAKLSILKNRAFGMSGYIGLNFDEKSRTFYSKSGKNLHEFGWRYDGKAQ